MYSIGSESNEICYMKSLGYIDRGKYNLNALQIVSSKRFVLLKYYQKYQI